MDPAERDREALLDAALQQWADDGWAAVDPVTAAQRAGVAPEVAAEFADGVELACEVFDHIVDERSAAMLQAPEMTDPNPLVRFRLIMNAMLDDIGRDPRRAVVMGDAFGCPALVARRRSANRGFGELVAAAPLVSGIDPDDLRLAGHFTLGGITEIALAWLDPDSSVDRARAVEHGAKLMEACSITR